MCLEDVQEYERAQRKKESKRRGSVSDDGEPSESDDALVKTKVGYNPGTRHTMLNFSPRKLLGPAYRLSWMTRAKKNKTSIYEILLLFFANWSPTCNQIAFRCSSSSFLRILLHSEVSIGIIILVYCYHP